MDSAQNHDSTGKSVPISIGNDPVIEPFSAYHHIEWLYDHQIAATPSLGQPQRALVDEWCKMVKHVFDTWPADKPILLLADLRREVSPSPYQTAKANELLNYRPDHRAYVAVVTSNNLSRQITRLTLRARNRPNGHVQQAFTRESGLEWLLQIGSIQRQATSGAR